MWSNTYLTGNIHGNSLNNSKSPLNFASVRDSKFVAGSDVTVQPTITDA